MGKWKPSPPSYISSNVGFQVHFSCMGRVSIKGSDFVSVFGIQAKRGDKKTAEEIARQLWPVLELIARDAVEEGRVRDRGSIGKATYTIDRETLDHYADKYSLFIGPILRAAERERA